MNFQYSNFSVFIYLFFVFFPKNLPEQDKLNYEQNLQDAMSIMPRLQTGLDVNVKFTG